MKKLRLLALLLAMVLCFQYLPLSATAADIVASGYCGGEGDGTNLTWTLTSDGTLTISGTGTMTDYSSWGYAPWYRYRGSIKFLNIDDSITTIGNNAFYYCDALTTVEIGDSIKTIGDSAFQYCRALTTVEIPDSVTTIDWDAFLGCSALTTVEIGDGVTYIGWNAFYNCDALTTMEIGGSVKTIDDCAFLDCDALTTVKIGDSVTTIGYHAFKECSALTTVEIGDSVTTIDDSAFYGCSALTSVKIPDSVIIIDKNAFNGCSALTAVEIGDGVTNIGYGAFYNCDALTTVEIGDSVKTIGGNAFCCCDALTAVEVASANKYYTSVNGVLYTKDMKTLVTYPYGAQMEFFAVPDSVTTIGSNAFYDCDALTTVEIPDSVTTIGSNAFYDCDALTTMEIGDSVTTIGGGAFENCDALTTVKIGDSVRIIGDDAFRECSALTTVEIGNSVTTIDDDAFYGCSALTTVKIPNSVTYIGYDAFCGCSALTTVKIPDSVTNIGCNAFYNCDALTTVEIGDSVKTIGYGAFENCDALTTVEIGGSVTTIDWDAFYRCDSLSAVYFKGDAPSVGSQAFDSTVTLYYIPGTTGWTDSSAYDAANDTWNGYKLATWNGPSEPDALYVEPVIVDGIVINGKGTAEAYFSLTDYEGNPVAEELMVARCNGTEYYGQTDGDGVFSIQTPRVNYADYKGNTRSGPVDLTMDLEFSLGSDPSRKIDGAKQTIRYQVTPPMFTQQWEGFVSTILSKGIGLGVGIKVGVAEVEANAAKLKQEYALGGGLKVEYDHTATGHDLTMSFSDAKDENYTFKTGGELAVLEAKIKTLHGSAGLSLTDEVETGLKIENYSVANAKHQLGVASFLLQACLAGERSVMSQLLLELVDVNGHNQSAAGQKITAKAGASLHSIDMAVSSEVDTEIAFANAECTAVLGYEKAEDHLDNTTTYTASAKTDYGYGLGKGFTLEDSQIKEGPGKYLWGNDQTNSLALSAEFDSGNALSGLSYKTFKDGEGSFKGEIEQTDVYATVSYDAEAAERLAAGNAYLKGFVTGKKGVFSPVQLFASMVSMANADETGSVKEVTSRKHGFFTEIPFSIQVLAELGAAVSGEFTAATSHVSATGVKTANEVYMTSQSTLTTNDIKAQERSLLSILNDPLEHVADLVGEMLVSAADKVANGVTNGYAAVKNATADFWVEIRRVGSALLQSYAVLALEDAALMSTDAAVAVTVGEPYSVAIYTDETGETLVSAEELEESPVTITLSYTDEMLQAAGVTSDAKLHIYRFDPERNLYICLESVQDKDTMSVSAQVTDHGEYILATDNASPLISDFAVSDGTAAPEITALVSDLSGIAKFSFRLDDGEVLVDETTLNKYYNTASGVFTYKCEGLSAGEHTAYFEATDSLGNANAEPFVFTFTVDAEAPELLSVTVPTEPVTESSFTVTAKVAEADDIAAVTVSATANGQTLCLPMTQEDGVWTAEVTDIAGLTSLDVTIIATDFAGNRTESEAVSVLVDVPAIPTGIVITTGDAADGKITVTVENHNRQATSGWLVCAAYDENGKMLTTGSTYVGLKAAQSKEYVLPFTCTDASTVKTFLMDISNGYAPRN